MNRESSYLRLNYRKLKEETRSGLYKPWSTLAAPSSSSFFCFRPCCFCGVWTRFGFGLGMMMNGMWDDFLLCGFNDLVTDLLQIGTDFSLLEKGWNSWWTCVSVHMDLHIFPLVFSVLIWNFWERESFLCLCNKGCSCNDWYDLSDFFSDALQ